VLSNYGSTVDNFGIDPMQSCSRVVHEEPSVVHTRRVPEQPYRLGHQSLVINIVIMTTGQRWQLLLTCFHHHQRHHMGERKCCDMHLTVHDDTDF
jgi:hypothetical protein